MKQFFLFTCGLIILLGSSALAQSVDANGVGVDGITKSFKAYRNASANKYYLIDISKPMFDATRLVPSDTGQIVILDAKNSLTPQPKNFSLVESSSTTFTDPIAVDAIYHFEKAYDFFNKNFGLLSYDNLKSSLRVVVHYRKNNEQALFKGTQKYFYFGDGFDTFKPLASGYDIVARNLAEAIITSQSFLKSGSNDQTGAALESMKDIFAVAADSVNWTIGESVTKITPNFINSLQTPHAGLLVTNETAYAQPENMNEFVYSLLDNGGVHINSGILNKAAYNLAQSIGRKNMAMIFFKSLTYIKAGANFNDILSACESAAHDLGISIATIDAAFDAVGITNKTRIETELLSSDFDTEDVADYTPLPYINGGVAMRMSPTKVPSQIMRIGFYVGDGNTGKNVRMRIYNDLNGKPSNIISEFQQTISDDNPHWEMKDVRANNIIVNGYYHVAIIFNGPAIGIAFDPFALDDSPSEFNGSSWQSSQTSFYIRSHVQRIINTTVVEKPSIVSSVELYQNHPNPITSFETNGNFSSTISYYLSESMNIRIKVFDVLGREITILRDGFETQGKHDVYFNASQLKSGLYFYRLESGQQTITRKMIIGQ